tara:strand:+ start:1833 stop:2051 length:219 start_codon:yes stop_codon:yes gene_type:complete
MNETYRTDSDTLGASPDARRDMMKPLLCDFDAIDAEAAENPICDNIAQQRSRKATGNVLVILDQINKERSAR